MLMSLKGNAIPSSINFFLCGVNIPFVGPCYCFIPVGVIDVFPCGLLLSSLSSSSLCV
jgi:hypothetical protein